MSNKEVIPAFDMLLEELERIIPVLNDQGKNLLDQKQYAQAHELINKAQSVVAFQGKVLALREEWVRMQVPFSRSGLQGGKLVKKTHQSKKGELTSRFEFYMPILQVLIDLGGRSHIRKVITELERRMGSHFTKKDLEKLPSGRQEIRWINTVRWTRQYMIGDGLLVKDSPRGIWEITQAGREFLTEKEKKQSTRSKNYVKPEIPSSLHYALGVYKYLLSGVYNFSSACRQVAVLQNLAFVDTVTDACTTALGLSKEQFIELTKNKHLFINRLSTCYPDHRDYLHSEI